LRLKIDDLEGRLGKSNQPHTESSEDQSSDEEIQKKVSQAGSRKVRAGVSAEVFGQNNKKEDFVAPVIKKPEATKEKLKKRLLQAFMFNALDKKELNIVVDAIEEV